MHICMYFSDEEKRNRDQVTYPDENCFTRFSPTVCNGWSIYHTYNRVRPDFSDRGDPLIKLRCLGEHTPLLSWGQVASYVRTQTSANTRVVDSHRVILYIVILLLFCLWECSSILRETTSPSRLPPLLHGIIWTAHPRDYSLSQHEIISWRGRGTVVPGF